ncbi:MAG: glycosyltransferase family 2 protein [Phycisphaerae bacterium]
MNIVIPMAGLGSRFRSAGYTTPKPLIPVLGKPMYAWATDSLPLKHAGRLIFVLLRSQPEFPELKADILSRYEKHHPVVLDVPALTAGQAVTVLTGRSLIDNGEELLIHNADTAFDIAQDWVAAARDAQVDGALLVFDSQEKRWSFSREGADGWVVEVREKVVISNHASTGTYYFRCGRQYVELADRMIARQSVEKGEYYVGPLYNDLIAAGGRVKNYTIDRLYCFGTPEDLAATLAGIGKDSG